MKKIAKIFLCLLICVLSSCASSKVEKQENLQTVETSNSSKKIKPIKYNEQKYQQAYQNRDYETCLGMLLHKTKKKADTLVTDKGRNGRYQRFHDDLVPYYSYLNEDCIRYIEQTYSDSIIN